MIISDIESAFDLFWCSGMRKVNKKAARKAFERLAKKKGDPMQFAFSLQKDIQVRLGRQFGFDSMHPATYLNGERWEDEKPVAANNDLSNVTSLNRSTRDMTLADEFRRDWAD